MHSRSSKLSEDAHSGRAAIPPSVQEDLDVSKNGSTSVQGAGGLDSGQRQQQ